MSPNTLRWQAPKPDPDNELPLMRQFKKAKHFVSTRFMLRARFLFVVPMPLFFMGLYSAFTGNAVSMMGRWGGLVLFLFAAWTLINGLKAENAYNERAVAKPPAIPRKLFASILTGLAIAVTASFGFTPTFSDPVAATIYALLAGILHSISFGLDPRRAKGLEGYSDYDADRLIEALEKGERLMDDTLTAAQTFPARPLQAQVERLVAEARQVFRAIERDPRDLPRARKFMSVYLQGARDASVKLANLQLRNPRDQAYSDYQTLITDLHDRFAKQKVALLENDRADLDVEVEVLRDRIKQER